MLRNFFTSIETVEKTVEKLFDLCRLTRVYYAQLNNAFMFIGSQVWSIKGRTLMGSSLTKFLILYYVMYRIHIVVRLFNNREI